MYLVTQLIGAHVTFSREPRTWMAWYPQASLALLAQSLQLPLFFPQESGFCLLSVHLTSIELGSNG